MIPSEQPREGNPDGINLHQIQVCSMQQCISAASINLLQSRLTISPQTMLAQDGLVSVDIPHGLPFVPCPQLTCLL